MNIKSVYVGKYREQSQTYSVCKDNNKKIKQDLQKMPKKLMALNAKAGQRNKLKTDYGSWFVMHMNDWAYAVCTPYDYPERHAYKLIQEIRQFTDKSKNKEGADFVKGLKKIVQQSSTKYEDLTKVDKVHKAQAQVNMLEQQLHTGIRKVLGNQQNLNELDDRAEEMKIFAKEFQTRCAKVQSITFWQKWKLILMIVAVVLAAFAFAAIIIMVRL